MPKDETPPHIKDKIWGEVCQKIPYSLIAKNWNVSKGTVSNIKKEYQKKNGIVEPPKPVSVQEQKRRLRIGRAAVVQSSLRKAEFIADGFVNAFDVIAYNSQHLVDIIDQTKEEADTIKTIQEEILEHFKKLEGGTTEGDERENKSQKEEDFDLRFAIRQSIQKINDFFPRLMLRIKAIGEMRKQLETFLKLKQEIMDIVTIRKMFDAFFTACDELDDVNYRKYRDRVVQLAPVTSRLFSSYEQTKAGMGDNSDTDKQEQRL